MKGALHEVAEAYSDSLLAQHMSKTLKVDGIALKLAGVNVDHTEDQKKLCRLLTGWKEECTYVLFGEAEISRTSAENWTKLVLLVQDAISEDINAVSGVEAWMKLPDAKQTARNTTMMRELAIKVGTEHFSQLPEGTQDTLKCVIRGGCCMHKDLNSTKGRNRAM